MRKSKKNKRPSAKKLKRQYEANEELLAVMAKHHAFDLNEDQRKATEKFLLEKYGLNAKEKASPFAFWNAVGGSENRRGVVNADKKYRETFIWAYTLYDRIASAEEWERKQHIAAVSEKAGMEVTPKFSLVRAVLRAAIDYDEDANPENRKKCSKDGRAMSYLISKGVRPENAAAYEGSIADWAKLGAKSKTSSERTVKAAVLASKFEKKHSRSAAFDESYLDDDYTGKAADYNFDEGSSREQHDLGRLYETSAWYASMLEFYSREHGIVDEEVMLSMVLGDSKIPGNVKVVGIKSLGRSLRPGELEELFELLVRVGSRLLQTPDHHSYENAGWQLQAGEAHANARRTASNRSRK